MALSSAKPRVLVLGTGAMASFFAARLARSGRPQVTIAGTWPTALSVIASRGILVEEGRERWSVPLQALTLEEARGPADLVLVLVKSYQTSGVAPVAARALAEDGLVVTMQNGLGNRETLAAAAGSRVVVGATRIGATLLGPGHVRAHPVDVALGLDPAHGARIEWAADILRAAGFETRVEAQAEVIVWRKLAASCAVNPLSALLGLPNGALLKNPEARQTLAAAAREVGAVAAGLGIDLGGDPADIAFEVAARTARNRSSMLQDLDRGAPTEIEALCGAVVAHGRRLGVPTPENERLWREIRRREAAGAPADAVPSGTSR